MGCIRYQAATPRMHQMSHHVTSFYITLSYTLLHFATSHHAASQHTMPRHAMPRRIARHRAVQPELLAHCNTVAHQQILDSSKINISPRCFTSDASVTTHGHALSRFPVFEQLGRVEDERDEPDPLPYVCVCIYIYIYIYAYST